MAANEYIYVMNGLGKFYPGGREVLRDIRLSFLPGAKIGVLGLNGAGKSTLLRIMAGLATEFTGEAWPAEGARVGFLAQEPELDPAKNVRANVLDGVAETRDLLRAFEEISAKFAEPMDDDEMNALLEKQGKLQDQIDAADAWELDRTLEVAMDALPCPPGHAHAPSLPRGQPRPAAARAVSVYCVLRDDADPHISDVWRVCVIAFAVIAI